MTLNLIKEGQSVTIIKINASKELKSRFNSFGIIRGATVHVERYSTTKQTMEIRVNKTRMALRLSEAKDVQVISEKN